MTINIAVHPLEAQVDHLTRENARLKELCSTLLTKVVVNQADRDGIGLVSSTMPDEDIWIEAKSLGLTK